MANNWIWFMKNHINTYLILFRYWKFPILLTLLSMWQLFFLRLLLELIILGFERTYRATLCGNFYFLISKKYYRLNLRVFFLINRMIYKFSKIYSFFIKNYVKLNDIT